MRESLECIAQQKKVLAENGRVNLLTKDFTKMQNFSPTFREKVREFIRKYLTSVFFIIYFDIFPNILETSDTLSYQSILN